MTGYSWLCVGECPASSVPGCEQLHSSGGISNEKRLSELDLEEGRERRNHRCPERFCYRSGSLAFQAKKSIALGFGCYGIVWGLRFEPIL